MIKAKDILQLKSFLSSIRLVLQGKELTRRPGVLSSLDSSVKVQRPKTKLVIKNKTDYPTLEGFHRTLQEIYVIFYIISPIFMLHILIELVIMKV